MGGIDVLVAKISFLEIERIAKEVLDDNKLSLSEQEYLFSKMQDSVKNAEGKFVSDVHYYAEVLKTERKIKEGRFDGD